MKLYELITEEKYNSLSVKRYPEAQFNLSAKKLDHIVIDGLKCKIEQDKFFNENEKAALPQPNDVFVAGGYFSNYVRTSPMAQTFPELFDYFQKSQDMDIFLNKQVIHAQTEKMGKLNLIHVPIDSTPTSNFDMDCCRIWCKPLENNDIYMATSLIDVTLPIYNEPTFSKEPEINDRKLFIQVCKCKSRLRRLKYMFKNCFDLSKVDDEIELAKLIFRHKRCNICDQDFINYHYY